MMGFSESPERQQLRAAVADLGKRYGGEWFLRKARGGEKTAEL